MLEHSLPNLLAIRIGIFLLSYATPLCLVGLGALCVAYGPSALSSVPGRILIGYTVVEAIFILLVWIPLNKRLKFRATYPPGLTRADRKVLLEKVLAHVPNPEKYLELWF